MLLFIILLLFVVLTGALFINLHPVFGGNPNKESKNLFSQHEHYKKGKFSNQQPTNMNMSISSVFSLMKDGFVGKSGRSPINTLPVEHFKWNNKSTEKDSVTWFGHSTFFISIDDNKILVDPMFALTASPVSFAGSKRYSKDLLYIIEELPSIDAVIITHDHYDHLDYPSILKLKNKVGHFFVPLGVGAHLLRWGIEKDRISELNWWEELKWEGLTLACVPSQHFSGRGLFNRNSTLWSGWVIKGKNTKFYTSGDGGYGPHFKEIGEKYGPFDLTLIEGGQYDKRWSAIHMQPEKSIQAHLDVKGRKMMLIHWGAFTLAYHPWTEPVERAVRAAKEKRVDIITPRIGETVILDSQIQYSRLNWWEETK